MKHEIKHGLRYQKSLSHLLMRRLSRVSWSWWLNVGVKSAFVVTCLIIFALGQFASNHQTHMHQAVSAQDQRRLSVLIEGVLADPVITGSLCQR
jgi:hypothetical protein